MERSKWNRMARAGLVLVAGLALVANAAAQLAVADGEISVDGTVTGSYADTWVGDGVHETIEEVESGGKPSKRTSLLEHKWTFDVAPGDTVTLHVRAHHDPNTEGDDFVFAWSTDDEVYADLLTVTKTAFDGEYQSGVLAAGISGQVFVRAMDTDRTPGNRGLERLYVDHLYVESSAATGPPNAPSGLVAAITEAAGYDGLELTWADNSTDEDGFEVERSLDGLSWVPLAVVGSNVTSLLDTGLLPVTTYSYQVRAFNGFGSSPWCDVATATTLPAVPFTIEQVADTDSPNLDLGFDAAGRPCFVYHVDGLVVFKLWDGQSWISEVVGPGHVDSDLSFVVSPAGRPSMAYQGAGLEVVFSERLATGWDTVVVDPVWPQTDRVSLAYDLDGNPAIAYRQAANSAKKRELRLARRLGGVWSVEAVEVGSGPKWKSLAFDALGNPAIAYEGWQDGVRCLKLARWSGSSWDIEVVESGPDFGYGARLAFDPTTGWPVMLHAGETPDWWELRLVSWSGSAWQADVVVPEKATFLPTRLVFTSAGVPYFAYKHTGQPPEAGTWVLHREGTSWVRELVAVWPWPYAFAMALDRTEQPAVLWDGIGCVKLARK